MVATSALSPAVRKCVRCRLLPTARRQHHHVLLLEKTGSRSIVFPASAGRRGTPVAPLGAAASFVPVSLVDRRADTHLEIELANACFVRLEGAIDPSLLEAAITAAGQLHGSGRGAE